MFYRVAVSVVSIAEVVHVNVKQNGSIPSSNTVKPFKPGVEVVSEPITPAPHSLVIRYERHPRTMLIGIQQRVWQGLKLDD